ncbi:chorismate-binding protein [Henriciella sp. AS95]|uniref:chorismate-binding protein n=1 Tax=Henriciella sp. AS95 TaxID=3135782 RepID=UPI00317D8E43
MIALLVADEGQPARLRTVCRKLDTKIPAEACFEILFARQRNSYWLDSSAHNTRQGRYSFMGDANGPLSEVVSYNVTTGHVRAYSETGASITQDNIFDFLTRRMAAIEFADQCPAPIPFKGGYVGYLGFESKDEPGAENTKSSSQPDAQFIFADRLVAFDHQTGSAWMVCVVEPGMEDGAKAWFDSVEASLNNSYLVAKPNFRALDASQAAAAQKWTPQQSVADMIGAFETTRDTLERGSLKDVCIASQWTTPFQGPALGVYQSLRKSNAAPFGAFLKFQELKILCCSPERMASISKDRKVRCEPMKGQAPRGALPVHDEDMKLKLSSNQQLRARNLKVAELVGSDLRNVCRMGSIRAEALCAIESLETGHHMVSRVSAVLKKDENAVSGVRTLFPAGSVIGAPRPDASKAIDSIEAGARGIFAGSIGYFSLDGSADFNVAMRTVTINNGQASTGTADSIVALENPAAEIKDIMFRDAAFRDEILGGTPLEFETVIADEPVSVSAD